MIIHLVLEMLVERTQAISGLYPYFGLSVKPKDLPEFDVHHVIVRNGAIVFESQIQVYGSVVCIQQAKAPRVLMKPLGPTIQTWKM